MSGAYSPSPTLNSFSASAESSGLNLLVAEDNQPDRMILCALLEKLGHRVFEVSNGTQAVEQFAAIQPDIVLLDAMMPGLDGLQAARQIKQLAGDRLVPLAFLTSLSDPRELARCLEAGGDDFLIKPFNRVILEAKLNALNRMRLLHQALSERVEQERRKNEQMLAEQKVARLVFDNVAHVGCLTAPNIRYHASPLSVFNGDVVFAANRPGGGSLVFLGDFTGHGLPAAIGAMPVAEIFYGMVAHGFRAPDILREINNKLRRILPVGMFCCGAMIETDSRQGLLRAWNGGLPDAWVLRTTGERVAIPSRNLPLGVRDPGQFSASMVVFQATPGDHVVLMTDGFSETRDQQGNMLGESGVRAVLAGLDFPDQAFDALLARIKAFAGRPESVDDLTLCALEITDTTPPPPSPPVRTGGDEAPAGAADWQCVYEVRESTLAEFNPLPLLLHICMEVPGLRCRSGEVYTLLSELYNNALEHGVLALSSEWKDSPRGFAFYYQERQRRLAETNGHFVRFFLSHESRPPGGRLRITCEDSGDGFDFASHSARVTGSRASRGPASTSGGYAGRGLELLRRMATRLHVHGKGNQVEVVYDWEPPTGTDGRPIDD
ncbi:MAG: SpoIIE family protein phosphatase [Alteromonadaceae bacterium]|nr:SpoIIE family protein phosphatase [Alteromonadaceae bacterium]